MNQELIYMVHVLKSIFAVSLYLSTVEIIFLSVPVVLYFKIVTIIWKQNGYQLPKVLVGCHCYHHSVIPFHFYYYSLVAVCCRINIADGSI